MKKIIVCLCMFLIMNISAFALECEYAVEPQFSSASHFCHGIARVYKDGQSAIIDTHGNYIIDFDDRVKDIRSNGLIMIVGENHMAAFFDNKGNQLTDYVYDTYPVTDPKWKTTTYYFVLSLSEGDGKSELVPFSRNKKYGYINPYGTEVVPPTYGYAGGFYNGIAEISDEGILSEYGTYTNGKYGLIKDNGQVILPSDSYWVASHSPDGEYAYAANGISDKVIVDRSGNIAKADESGYGRIDVKYIEVSDSEGRRGFVDRDRNVVIPMDFYFRLERVNEDYFIVNNAIVDNHNQEVYSAPEGVNINVHYLSTTEKSIFARISKDANDGIAGHTLQGLVNTYGGTVLEPVYESAYDLGEGLIYARDTEKNYLFDYFGNLLCELNGNMCGQCVDGVFSIVDFNTMKSGYMLNPLIHPKVYVDGEKLVSDVYPKIENSRTLVPIRAVFETMGAEVSWNNETSTVTVTKGDILLTLAVGSDVLYKNGEGIYVDVPAKVENDRVLVPLRVISEALDCTVDWDGENRVVNITVN